MGFLVIGVLGLLLKYLEVGFVAHLSWWLVLSPFAMAMAWWAWADASGYTARKAMEREQRRKDERIDRQRSQLGQLNRRSGRSKKR